jgi:pilus assembly protein Flp/PilA
MQIWRAFLKNEQGATAIEYALIGTLISVAMIGGLSAFSDSLNNRFDYLSNKALGDGKLGNP